MNSDLIKKLIGSVDWQFAKTMPEIPHEYIVVDNYPKKAHEISQFITQIRKNGYTKPFYGKEYRYLEINGYKYWVMPCPSEASSASGSVGGENIINRAKI